MKTFPFDEPISRRGTGSLKWDVKEGELPMWVADQDFPVADCIVKAVTKRAAHPVYGYQITPESWAKAYHDFYQDEFGWDFPVDSIFFATGVVPVLSSSVRALTEEGEKVLVLTPCYNIFFNSIVNNRRIPSECEMIELKKML